MKKAMVKKTTSTAFRVLLVFLALGMPAASRADDEPLDYRIELTAAADGFGGRTCWVHARAGAIPAGGPGNPGTTPLVVMTMQKLLLTGSDVFYALHNLWTDDLSKTWTQPKLQPVFERQKMGDEKRGSDNRVWVAKIKWNKPNRVGD